MDHTIPITHSLEVLLPRQPSLVFRINRVSTKNDGRNLKQFHPKRPRPFLLIVRHHHFANWFKKSVKPPATARA